MHGPDTAGLQQATSRPGNAHGSVKRELFANQKGTERSSSCEMSSKQPCLCTRSPTNHGSQSKRTCHVLQHDDAHDSSETAVKQQRCGRQFSYSTVDSATTTSSSSSSSSGGVRHDRVSYSMVSPWNQAASPAVYCATSTSRRRNRVYDNIMGQWKRAASSYVPSPRSSHRRILGGQALPTRQRGESFSFENSDSSLKPTWGNLSDTVSPAVQLAWREQLLWLKLSRLAGVPMTVLLRQRGERNTDTDATEACRVVASSQNLSAKLTALAVIEGDCLDVAFFAPSRATAGSTEGVPGSSGATCCETGTVKLGVIRQEVARRQQQQQQRCHNTGTSECSREADNNKVFVEEPREKASADQGHGRMNASTATVTSGNSSSERRARVPPPVRGFHLVDLHAVVRNSVEWRHCLPKVEPCFRVGSNRDGVLLGLVHALGGRLSCSSAHDVRAGLDSACRASPIPAPPPRLLDRHVCRSPGLLRASAAAGVQLYEVDSADELRRIWAASRKVKLSVGTRSRSETAHGCTATTLPHSRAAAVLGPASVMVRLAMPYRSRRQFSDGFAEAPAVTDFSGACEAVYGAEVEDVVELVRAATATTAAPVGPECGMTKEHSTPGSRTGNSLPIVGFSIDVGPACWDDALAGSAVVLPPFGEMRPDAPCPTPATAATGVASEGPGKAIPSTALAESIDAAVSFAVNMARVAAEAAAAAAVAAMPASPAATVGADGDATGNRREDRPLTTANVGSTSRRLTTTTTPALTSSPSSHPAFSFQRLHVTGLGKGGARGEPLVALRAALARHLPGATAAGAGAGATATSAAAAAPSGSHGSSGSRSGGTLPSRAPVGRPIVVSADATEYLVSGGVWSTVASIIGRKSVSSVAAAIDADHYSPTPPSPAEVSGVAVAGTGEETCCPSASEGVVDGEGAGADAGGAMYYIDDGCYGSLSGALLRGVQMQPSPLRAHLPQPQHELGSLSAPAAAAAAAADEPGPDSQVGGEKSTRAGPARTSGTASEPPKPCVKELTSCTVWGPTCDGLDCVCRTTQLPDDLEPGKDWLFFPDVGIRSAADTTDFNGLKPLDSFYFIRQREDPAPAPSPAPTASQSLARAVYP